MKKLYFVRHGESEMNVAKLSAGSTETPLTDLGRRQAKDAGKKATKLGIDYIVCSSLGRAFETAEIIAKEIGYPIDKIHKNSLFNEQHFGEEEGKPWKPDIDMDGVVDVETSDTIINRAKMAIEFLETIPEHTILVVSHGRFGRAMRHHILGHSFHDRSNLLANAEIVQWL